MAEYTLNDALDFDVPLSSDQSGSSFPISDIAGIGNLVFATWRNGNQVYLPDPDRPGQTVSPDFRLYEYNLTSKTHRIIELPWFTTDAFGNTNLGICMGVTVNETHIFTANRLNTVGQPRGDYIHVFLRDTTWIGAVKITDGFGDTLGKMALDNDGNLWGMREMGRLAVYPLSQILGSIRSSELENLIELTPSIVYEFNIPSQLTGGLSIARNSIFRSGLQAYQTDGHPLGRWNIDTFESNSQPEDQIFSAPNNRTPQTSSSMYIFEGRYYTLYEDDILAAWNGLPPFPDEFEEDSNLFPVADAGPDRTIDENTNVILNGSGSFDPDGTVVSYLWEQISGDSVSIPDPDAVLSSFQSLPREATARTFTFQLTVVDNGGLSGVDTVVLTVPAIVPPPVPESIVDTDGDGLDEGDTVIMVGDEETEVEYTVVLTAPPTDDVTVTIDVPEDSGLTTDMETLTFTPDNWNIPQTVTVTIDTAPITTDPPTLTFTVDDWNIPQTVVLTAPPAEDVTVILTTPDGLGIEPDPPTLTFTPDNWNVPQGVTLDNQPTNDVIVTLTVPEDIERAYDDTLITHTASGGGYDDVPFSSVLITVLTIFCTGGVSRLRYSDPLAGEIPVSTNKGILGTIPVFTRRSNKGVLTAPPPPEE